MISHPLSLNYNYLYEKATSNQSTLFTICNRKPLCYRRFTCLLPKKNIMIIQEEVPVDP